MKQLYFCERKFLKTPKTDANSFRFILFFDQLIEIGFSFSNFQPINCTKCNEKIVYVAAFMYFGYTTQAPKRIRYVAYIKKKKKKILIMATELSN